MASPALNPPAVLPTAATSPEKSVPRMGCRGRRTPETSRLMPLTSAPLLRFASRVCTSARETPAARIFTRISSGLGSGFGTSAMRSTSGGP